MDNYGPPLHGTALYITTAVDVCRLSSPSTIGFHNVQNDKASLTAFLACGPADLRDTPES